MSLKYIKPFDGLRGLGALFIVSYHWPGTLIRVSHGWEFMQLFFVMSGYLIAMVLQEEKGKFPFNTYALRFYIKRSLRLFPLYLLYLFFWIVIYLSTSNNDLLSWSGEIYKHAGYLFTYTYNFMTLVNFLSGLDYSAGLLSTHLWTLSLEEQFYLVFPFIVFFLSEKRLKHFLIACIILAPVLRVICYFLFTKLNPADPFWVAQNIVRLPFLQMDSLAFGALLAVFKFEKIKNPVKLFRWFTVIIILIYAANIGYTKYIQGLSYYQLTFGKKIAENWMTHNYLFVYIITMVNAWCMLMLLCLIRGFNMAWLLESRLLVFIGKHSYAIYLFHLPLMFLFFAAVNAVFPLNTVFKKTVLDIPLFLLYLLIISGLAHLSFKYFESYFIRFKNKIARHPD
jgi:peptidoglycan/LPS O-acetylase OafA/YrhL